MNNTQTDPYMCYEEDYISESRTIGAGQRYGVLNQEFRLVEELIKLRQASNLTQAELAEKVGLKQAAIARLESGRTNPTFMTLARIAEALDKKLAIV